MTTATAPVIAIADMIGELRRELAIRGEPPFTEGVYASHIERKRLSLEAATRQVARLKAAIATLEWLRDNEAKIRAKVTP